MLRPSDPASGGRTPRARESVHSSSSQIGEVLAPPGRHIAVLYYWIAKGSRVISSNRDACSSAYTAVGFAHGQFSSRRRQVPALSEDRVHRIPSIEALFFVLRFYTHLTPPIGVKLPLTCLPRRTCIIGTSQEEVPVPCAGTTSVRRPMYGNRLLCLGSFPPTASERPLCKSKLYVPNPSHPNLSFFFFPAFPTYSNPRECACPRDQRERFQMPPAGTAHSNGEGHSRFVPGRFSSLACLLFLGRQEKRGSSISALAFQTRARLNETFSLPIASTP